MILDNQPIVKKRRGRRKNVEGVDILFLNRNKPPNHVSKNILKLFILKSEIHNNKYTIAVLYFLIK